MSVLSLSTLISTGVLRYTADIETDGSITVAQPDLSFACAVLPPKEISSSTRKHRLAPRDDAPKYQVWWAPAWRNGTPDLDISDRLEIDGELFELTSNGRAMRAGPTIYGYHADALPISVLYPLLGEIQEIGGETVVIDVPCATWRPAQSDRVGQRGAYEDLGAEMPAEYWQYLKGSVNRQLVVGEDKYRITAPDLHTSAPHITMNITAVEYR